MLTYEMLTIRVDVNSREFCTIIENHAQIKWYFQCSIVFLSLCKEYLNTATFKIPIFFPIKNEYFDRPYRMSSYDIIYRSYKLSKFFVAPSTMYVIMWPSLLEVHELSSTRSKNIE